MARDPEEIVENTAPQMAEQSIYPYGLSVCLTQDELDKLDLDSDCEVGDILHMVCMARVTSISKNQMTNGESCRIEMQIFDIETLEDENEEFERPVITPSKFYKA